MKPIIFESTETEFKTNGLGRISPVSCTVTEERNGAYELECSVLNSDKLYSEIKPGRILYCMHAPNSDLQPFRIYKVESGFSNRSTVYARHISYDLSQKIVMPFSASSAPECMTGISKNAIDCPFTFSTDLKTTANFTSDVPCSVRSIFGGSEGSIIDVYGGEFHFDKWNVELLKSRGSDRGVTLRYGKNIADLTNTIDSGSIYTACVPYYKSQDTVIYLDNPVVKSSYYDKFPYGLTKAIDFTEEINVEQTETEGESGLTDSDISDIKLQLEALASAYLENNKVWLASQNIEISFTDLSGAWSAADLKNLETVGLCDIVTAYYPPLGVNVKTKVIKATYNVLLNRFDSVELGESRPNLSETMFATACRQVFGDTPSAIKESLNAATKLINSGSNGYVIFNRGTNGQITEILVLNTPDKNTATEVLRINKNGIGFSSGIGQDFKTAWTLDGTFIGDNIKAGTISDAAGRNVWDLDSGTFYLGSVDENNKSSINIDGGVLSTEAVDTGTTALYIYDTYVNFFNKFSPENLDLIGTIGTAPNYKTDDSGNIVKDSNGNGVIDYNTFYCTVDNPDEFQIARHTEGHTGGIMGGDSWPLLTFSPDGSTLARATAAGLSSCSSDFSADTVVFLMDESGNLTLGNDGKAVKITGKFAVTNYAENIGIGQNSDGNLEMFNRSLNKNVSITIRGGGKIEILAPSGLYVNGTKIG